MTTMITRPTSFATMIALTFALLTLAASAALAAPAACSIEGQITAGPAGLSDPAPFVYTLTVTWDTGNRYALSHFEVFLDESNCACEDLSLALIIPDPAGESSSPESGPVSYASWVECNGEPSLGLDGQFLKFEPLPGEMDEPGTTGTGTFSFYSHYPPAPVAPLNLFLSDKNGQYSCQGTLTGVFPALPCDPTGTTPLTWGSLKSQYGR